MTSRKGLRLAVGLVILAVGGLALVQSGHLSRPGNGRPGTTQMNLQIAPPTATRDPAQVTPTYAMAGYPMLPAPEHASTPNPTWEAADAATLAGSVANAMKEMNYLYGEIQVLETADVHPEDAEALRVRADDVAHGSVPDFAILLGGRFNGQDYYRLIVMDRAYGILSIKGSADLQHLQDMMP